MSAWGLIGMMRNPRRWRPAGTDPPALNGSRDAPTTAMVRAAASTSWGLRLTYSASRRRGAIFQVVGDQVRCLFAGKTLDEVQRQVDSARDSARGDPVAVVDHALEIGRAHV